MPMPEDLQRAALSKLSCPWVQRTLVLLAGLVALGLGLGLSSAPDASKIDSCHQDSAQEDHGYAKLLGRKGCR